jgi:hypothetical protein
MFLKLRSWSSACFLKQQSFLSRFCRPATTFLFLAGEAMNKMRDQRVNDRE